MLLSGIFPSQQVASASCYQLVIALNLLWEEQDFGKLPYNTEMWLCGNRNIKQWLSISTWCRGRQPLWGRGADQQEESGIVGKGEAGDGMRRGVREQEEDLSGEIDRNRSWEAVRVAGRKERSPFAQYQDCRGVGHPPGSVQG